MRVLALLLLAAVLGFAVGRVTAPEGGGRGGQRRVPATPTAGGAPPVGNAAPVGAPPPASGIDEPPAGTVMPSQRCADGDFEAIRVDFEGFEGERTAWLGRTTLRGAFEERSEAAEDDGVATFVYLYPGVYDVWWLDPEGRRLGTRAAVEAKKITTLRAVDHRTPAPIPDGLGVLSLHFEVAGGGDLATPFALSRPSVAGMDADVEEQADLSTNARGDASVAVIPGRYEIRVGDHRSEVVVKEGATTVHRVAHEHEGDLVILADRPMDISVKSTLDPFEETSHSHATHAGWAGRVGPGQPVVVPHMREGEYFIYIQRWSFEVPLARVTVRAGQATRVDCKAPAGGLALKVAGTPAPQDGLIKLCRVVEGRAEETTRETSWLRSLDRLDLMLMPGRYIVTVSADGYEPASAEFEVSDRVVELALELSLAR